MHYFIFDDLNILNSLNNDRILNQIRILLTFVHKFHSIMLFAFIYLCNLLLNANVKLKLKYYLIHEVF